MTCVSGTYKFKMAEQAVSTAGCCDEMPSFGLTVKLRWTCQACEYGSGRSTWTLDEAREGSCVNPNHAENLNRWILKFHTDRDSRVDATQLLAGRAESLSCEADRREVKAMLFDFVHKPAAAPNLFLSIVKRLQELERNNTRAALALAAWKILAESKAADQPIERKAKKLKTIGQVRAFAMKYHDKWRVHLKSIADSGDIELVVRLVSPWHS
jgi:hypothetical protein